VRVGVRRCVDTEREIVISELRIERLDPAETSSELIENLTRLVNDVYASAEQGLWREHVTRTNRHELAGLIAAGEVVVARTGEGVVGMVRAYDRDACTGGFGMLAVDHAERGLGIGRALIDEIEREAGERARTAMQLELLVPTGWRHPSKEFLAAWYGRRGYRKVATSTMETVYPRLAPLMVTPCELQIYRKNL
jgi:GNAT superfamily N-acetyltransferase